MSEGGFLILLLSSPLLGPAASSCVSGWKEWLNLDARSFCYKFSCPMTASTAAGGYGRSADDARRECLRNTSDIVSIQSKQEDLFLSDLIQQYQRDTWIGLDYRLDYYSYRWRDTSVSEYTNWDRSQPDLDHHCTLYDAKSGRWKTGHCNDRHCFMCKYIDDCSDWRAHECHQTLATCVDTLTGYTCTCHHGYVGNGYKYGGCSDLDECGLHMAGCDEMSTRCENTAGSFICSCKPGFRRKSDTRCLYCPDTWLENTSNGNLYCYKVKPTLSHNFSTSQEVCGNMSAALLYITSEDEDKFIAAATVNVIPDHSSIWLGLTRSQDGWTWAGVPNVASLYTNWHPQEPLVHQCSVLELNSSVDEGNRHHWVTKECDSKLAFVCKKNYDECVSGDHACSSGNSSRCENTVSSYLCHCLPGFQGNGTWCEDTNECFNAHKRKACSDISAKCYNLKGSFECQCIMGYELSEYLGTCSDIDECDREGNVCADAEEGGRCVNEDGSYRCECRSGFLGTGLVCLDQDECDPRWSGRITCHKPRVCINIPGSYECHCPHGFASVGVGDEQRCVLNECVTGQHMCQPQVATCTDTTENYTCSCHAGYSGDGFTCEDINECVLLWHDCDSTTMCRNTPGSYDCVCGAGFQQHQGLCSDLDECATGGHSCSRDTFQTCVNIVGSFLCLCESGFQVVQTDDGSRSQCQDENECEEHVTTVGNQSSVEQRLAMPCLQEAACLNTAGSYLCVCGPGLTGDGIDECVDVDECDDEDMCHRQAQCVNMVGSYQCQCLPGYQPQDKKKRSSKVTHHESNTHNPSHGGNRCEDVDECQHYQDPCPTNSHCQNTEGSYVCHCSRGFIKEPGSERCGDLDECDNGVQRCGDGWCMNTLGSFDCLDSQDDGDWQLSEGKLIYSEPVGSKRLESMKRFKELTEQKWGDADEESRRERRLLLALLLPLAIGCLGIFVLGLHEYARNRRIQAQNSTQPTMEQHTLSQATTQL